MGMLLKDGKIVAASDAGFILIYKHEPSCKRLLREDNRQIVQGIIQQLFGRPYEFLVLPEYFWLEVRGSYLAQRNQGLEPKLKQYSQNLKNVIDYKEEGQEPKRAFADEIIDLYGPDLVQVHE